MRRAEAIAFLAEMSASVTAKKAELILAQASIPAALAQAFRNGQFNSGKTNSTDPNSILKFPGSRESA
jgi:uncharacterized protein YqfA (UPF0365 family)